MPGRAVPGPGTARDRAVPAIPHEEGYTSKRGSGTRGRAGCGHRPTARGRGRADAVAVAARREPSLAPRSPPARPALSVPPGSGFLVEGRCFRSPVPPPPSPEQPPRRAPAARRCLPSPAPAQPSPAGRGARQPRPGGGRQRAPTRRGPGRTLGAAASPAARVPAGGAEGARRSPQPWQDAAFLADPAGALLHPPLPRQHHRALVVSRISQGGCQEGAQGPSLFGGGSPSPAWGQSPLHSGHPLGGNHCSLARWIHLGGTPTLLGFRHMNALGAAGWGDPGGMGHTGPVEGAAAGLLAPQACSLGGLCACGAGKGGQGPPEPSNKSTLIKSPRIPTVSPPEWWSGCSRDKTPVCNGAFIKGRDGALQDTGGGGGFITGAELGPSLGKPRYLSKHELFKSIKNFTQPVFIRF